MSLAFAIVPAAGHSARMGRPKLLLPLGGRPLIAHTIDSWQAGGVDKIVVVVRADDTALAAAVESLQYADVDLVRPSVAPPDMKASVHAALLHIGVHHARASNDCFLVAPADMPRLSPEIIRALTARHEAGPGEILVPTLGGRRGHPVLFPWPLAGEVFQLAEGDGLNVLTSRHSVAEIACEGLAAAGGDPFADIDTPDQYRSAGGE